MLKHLTVRATPFRLCLLLLALPWSVSIAHAEVLSGNALVAALRAGGYVIVLRHASSPRTLPAPAEAHAGNTTPERQLDEEGQSTARAMGAAMRRMKIPLGPVLSSPTFRALETVRVAGFGIPITFPELGDGGQSMAADTGGARGAWLKSKAAEAPPRGTDTMIVTHYPNMAEAFPRDTDGLKDGEALILHPDGKGSVQVVAHVRIEEWSHLDEH